MSPKPTRVAIYLRVSKDDGSQETDNQLLQLREFCERWEVHGLLAEYVDRESGTRDGRERRDFDRMFADAARKRFDVLLFWALDRFSREGIRKDHRLPRAPRPLRGGVQVLRGAHPRHRQRADSPHSPRGDQPLCPAGGLVDLRQDEGGAGEAEEEREGAREAGRLRAPGAGLGGDEAEVLVAGEDKPGDGALVQQREKAPEATGGDESVIFEETP